MHKLNIEYLIHTELDDNLLLRIINLKRQHWDYSFESHKKWINDNIQSNDYHLWIETSDMKLLAYLNLVNVLVDLDDKQVMHKGIGNVCVDKEYKGKGLGKLIMDVAAFFIKQTNDPAILLCSQKLVEFYQKTGWHLFKNKTILIGKPYDKFVFFNYNCNAKLLKIDKNF